MTNVKKQQGTALILALLVVTITAAIATTMMVRQQVSISRAELVMNVQHAYLQAQGIEYAAIDRLANDLRNQKPNKVVDPSPIIINKQKIPGGSVQGKIIDMQSKFNINNLSMLNYIPGFINFLITIDPDINKTQAKNLTYSIHNWLVGANTDSGYYAEQKPPYRPGNRLMTSISELRLVHGINATIYNTLLPYVTALPGNNTAINLNTAPAVVLLTLGGSITLRDATKVLQQRPFTTNNISSIPFIKDLTGTVVATSQYFLSQAYVTIGAQHLRLNTLLNRNVVNQQPNLTTLWQSRGTL